MTYNIHPLFVHFPIAFLFVYSIIKIVPLKKWLPQFSWKDIEVALLVVGVLGAFASLATGEAAEEFVRANRQLIDMHAGFATAATWIYGALLAGSLAALLNAQQFVYPTKVTFIPRILSLIESVFCHRTFSAVLAVLGLITLSVAGLLGGVITYGVTADPVAGIVLQLLGITL